MPGFGDQPTLNDAAPATINADRLLAIAMKRATLAFIRSYHLRGVIPHGI
jgi:hypothetical protein